MRQIATFLYNPSNGLPYLTDADGPTAEAFREQHGPVAWLYNPWTRERRDPRDIGTDVLGRLIVPPYEEGEYTPEEQELNKEYDRKLWSYRYYGSAPQKGYSICWGTGTNRDTVLYLGDALDGDQIQALVNAHNDAVGQGRVMASLEIMRSFATSMSALKGAATASKG